MKATKRFMLTLAAILGMTGAWAQDTDEVTVVKSANNNEWTLTMPASDVELEVEYKADLTLTLNIEGWTFGTTANAPAVSGNEGNGTVTYEYKMKGAADDSYSTEVPTDAGEYTVRATVVETDDYADGTATADFIIAQAAATISYETASVSKTYGDADFTNDLTNTGNGTVTYASNNESVATVNSETGLVHIVGSGEATITATVVDGTNYTYAVKTAQYAIGVNTAAMSVTATNYTGTYDGDSHTITVTVTEPEGTTVKYGTVEGTYDLDEAPAYTDAGIYSVFYQVTKANYTTVEGSAIVTINKAAGVISFAESSMSKTYGDADFTNTLTNTGDGTVTYTSNNENIATVNSETGLVTIMGAPGDATITATVTDGTNYAYTTTTATFTIGVNTAAITVSAEGFTGTYDGASHTITVTVTEPEGTTVKYGTTAGEYILDAAPTYTDAGEYTIYYQVTKANYTTVENSAVVSIQKAAATISYETASVSKTYGDADFTNDLTNTGNGTVTYTSNNESVATVNSETGLVHIVGSGEATITATVADGTNYTYAVKTAQYAIGVNTAAMSVTATNYTGTYDGDSHTITVTVTEPEGTTVKYGTVEGTYDLDEAPAYTDAGIYNTYYQVTKANYTTVQGSAIVTIEKAAGVISFAESSVSKTYGDADFTNTLTNTGDGTVTYTSNNESVATVNSETGLVTITGAPGEATITATVTDGTNYAYTTTTATFTIGVNTAAITVSAEGFTGTYDGASHTITVTVSEPEGTTVKYGTTAGEYTLDAAPTYTDAGEYTIYYQVTKANYTTVENSAVVSIQKAAASISYETTAVSKTTNDEAFVNALTMTGDGTVTYSSDNVNVATVNSETGEVTIKGTGNATIKATVVDGTNYTYATKTAQYTLTVEAATGISDVKTDTAENANWYDLSGRPLNGKPTKAGVYVKNGKNVVIK